MLETGRPLESNGIFFRLISSLGITCAVHSNHMIVISRLLCAALLLVLAMTDPFSPGFKLEFDDVFALVYAGIALTSLFVISRSWYADFTLAKVFFLADTLAFILFVIPHSIGDTEAYASTLCLMAHIVFSSGLRWRFPAAFATWVFLNTFWSTDILLFEVPNGKADHGSILRWIVFAIIGSLIVLWASRRVSTMIAPRFMGDAPVPGLPMTATALGYVMRASGASGVTLCWIDPESSGCFIYSVKAAEDVLPEPPRRMRFVAAAAFYKLETMLFDLTRNRAIVSNHGSGSLRAVSSVPGEAFLRELGVQQGICIAVDSDEGRSWLILSGVKLIGCGHLQWAEAIRAEVAHGINWQIASAKARETALLRLRHALAGDLHDSVAHSLAGARFLLVALQSKVSANREVANEIKAVREAIEAEHLHVRKLIKQLRETDADTGERNLIADIELLCAGLASRWRARVKLVNSDFRVGVPSLLSLEIQQIVREAVSNAVRHGAAKDVTITCRRRSETLKLVITDNGSGFPDPRRPARPRSISDRVKAADGSLEITSSPEETVLQIAIPLPDTD